MNKREPDLVRPTAEEEAETAAQLAEDPDTYEEGLRAGLIQRVTITLDRETIAWFRAQTGEDGDTGGTRWLELVARTLRDHAHGGRKSEA